MDGHRFDGFAKSVATWSSRRRFLGKAAGAATGAAFISFRSASAAATDLSISCGPDTSTTIQGTIQDRSLGLQTRLKDISLPETTNVDGPQFAEFLQQVKCLLAQGGVALSDQWTPGQTRLFLNQAQGIISAMSVGFTGSFFSEASQAERPGAIRTLLTLKKSDICGHGGCIAGALNDELVCMHNCPTTPPQDKEICEYDCFVHFLIQLFLGIEATGSTPAVEACLPGLAAACEGDCCLSNCISKGP